MNPFGGQKQKWCPFAGMFPTLFIFLMLGVIPSILGIVASFTDLTGVPGVPLHFIGLKNYEEFFVLTNKRDLFDVIWKTIEFAVIVTIVQNTVALFVAIILNKGLKGRNIYRAIIFLPCILGVTVTGLIWTLVLNPTDGPMKELMTLLHLQSNFYGDYKHAFGWVMFTQIWMCMGTSLIIFLSGLQSISNELYESASIDGATKWTSFKYITFPLIWPTITINTLLAIIGALNTYEIIFVTTRGEFNTKTLPMLIYQTAYTGAARQGYAQAMGMVMFALTLTATLVTKHYMDKKEVY